MRLPWRCKVKTIEPSHKINLKHAELETAKQILAEIFQVRLGEVDEMIQMRLEERSWETEQTLEDSLWPATFCLVE